MAKNNGQQKNNKKYGSKMVSPKIAKSKEHRRRGPFALYIQAKEVIEKTDVSSYFRSPNRKLAQAKIIIRKIQNHI